MENIDQMLDRHRKEIAELQKKCNHPEISNWMDEWWAPGHSTGRSIKTCRICGKVVKIKT